MKQGKSYLIAACVSLLVPIILLGFLEISTNIKNSKQNHDPNLFGQEIVINTDITDAFYLYWYSYTAPDFVRDYFLTLLFFIGIFLFRRIFRREKGLDSLAIDMYSRFGAASIYSRSQGKFKGVDLKKHQCGRVFIETIL